jgi:hypothetical protein
VRRFTHPASRAWPRARQRLCVYLCVCAVADGTTNRASRAGGARTPGGRRRGGRPGGRGRGGCRGGGGSSAARGCA